MGEDRELFYLQEAYATATGVDRSSVGFLLNRKRVEPMQTPQMLKMNQGDLVAVQLDTEI